ncbi:Uncharacterised protein [Amycolatopsis camponoti]|uniref:Uncharacterized protein n=1 Tax=Amycolatopsis camponoti TaxID=2606593 RepID=A0A6I8M0Z6_9PSEU|nr:Uncharacterised protein [Amycolatopsis camponoti]
MPPGITADRTPSGHRCLLRRASPVNVVLTVSGGVLMPY